MRIKKDLELAWNILVHSKLRSWLTIIGIIIGIGSVVAIVSISQGAQKQMQDNLKTFKTDQITITAGNSRANNLFGGGGGGEARTTTTTSSLTKSDPTLTTKDVLAIQSVKNVKKVIEKVSGSEDIIYASKKSSARITAINSQDFSDITDNTITTGRALNQADIYSVVVGQRTADSFDGMEINRQMTINGKTFKIVGIIANENGLYIPLSSVVGVITDKEKGVYDSLIAVAQDGNLVQNTTDDIQNKLMLSRGILLVKDKDFSVSNMLSMQQTITSTLNALALFLGAIAAISLLVGGIGIANTMFTSVLEKTKEIGIMKAVGVRNSDVLMIYLLNAGLIGLVGGIGGIILGGAGSIAISSFAGIGSSATTTGSRGFSNLLSSSYLSWQLVIGALLFSILIGMIAGVIPAYRASKLKPVDALRYE